MIRILIADGMDEGGLALLKQASGFEVILNKKTSPEELMERVGEVTCLVVRSATQVTDAVLKKGAKLKLVVRAGAGVDNIDVAGASKLGIKVMNTATANSNAVAELTIALLFSLFRKIPAASSSLSGGRWEKEKFVGSEVMGKKLGLVGLGNIGKMVAEKAKGLGMSLCYYDPAGGGLAGVERCSTIEDLLARSDVVSLHLPKTKETAGLFNEPLLLKIKRGGYLINCARGGLVDEDAVVRLLDSNHLDGVAFDVYSEEPPKNATPLMRHPKAICIPHLGASTKEAQARVGTIAAAQMVGFFLRNETEGVLN